MDNNSYYKILEISKDASKAQIAQRFEYNFFFLFYCLKNKIW